MQREYMKHSEHRNVEGFRGSRFSVQGLNIDAHVKSQKAPVIVIPANAGIQENQLLMDSRVRGSEGLGDFLRDYQYSIFNSRVQVFLNHDQSG